MKQQLFFQNSLKFYQIMEILVESVKKIALPHLKKSPKKPNQKWVKCCLKGPISQVHLQTFLFILQFSTRCLKTLSWTYVIKYQLQTDAFKAFVKSLSSVPPWAQRHDKGHCCKAFT